MMVREITARSPLPAMAAVALGGPGTTGTSRKSLTVSGPRARMVRSGASVLFRRPEAPRNP